MNMDMWSVAALVVQVCVTLKQRSRRVHVEVPHYVVARYNTCDSGAETSFEYPELIYHLNYFDPYLRTLNCTEGRESIIRELCV